MYMSGKDLALSCEMQVVHSVSVFSLFAGETCEGCRVLLKANKPKSKNTYSKNNGRPLTRSRWLFGVGAFVVLTFLVVFCVYGKA